MKRTLTLVGITVLITAALSSIVWWELLLDARREDAVRELERQNAEIAQQEAQIAKQGEQQAQAKEQEAKRIQHLPQAVPVVEEAAEQPVIALPDLGQLKTVLPAMVFPPGPGIVVPEAGAVNLAQRLKICQANQIRLDTCTQLRRLDAEQMANRDQEIATLRGGGKLARFLKSPKVMLPLGVALGVLVEKKLP